MTRITLRARRRRASLALALTSAATAAALPATAVPASAAGWQPVANLTTTARDGLNPRVVRAADGSVTAIWTRSADDALATSVVEVATRPPGGAWSEPRTISSSAAAAASDVDLTVGADGTLVATWGEDDPAVSGTLYSGWAAIKRPGADWGAPTRFELGLRGTEALSPGPAAVVAPDGTVTIAWSQRSADDARNHLQVVSTTADGGWGTPRQVTASPDASDPALARGADGTLAVTWRDYDATTGNYTIWGAVRPAGGDWQPRRQLSDSGRYSFGLPQVAVGPDGETTIVFQSRTDNARYARYQALSASWSAEAGWSATAEELVPYDRTITAQDPKVAVDAAGTVTAAFLETDYDGDDQAGVRATADRIQVATRAAGTRRWSAARTIAVEPPNATLRKVALAVGGDGAATVAWAGYETAEKRAKIVRAARREAGASEWSAVTDLSAPGGASASQMPFAIGVAAGADGGASVVWHINDSSGATVVQAVDYEVERPPAEPTPTPGVTPPLDPAPAPVQPPPTPTPATQQPPTSSSPARRAAARRPRLRLAWRGRTLVVRVVDAPAKGRLRIVVGSGRTARAVTARGRAVTLPAKLSTPGARIAVRLLSARGVRLASFATRIPRRATHPPPR
jgi:hypothetical protein